MLSLNDYKLLVAIIIFLFSPWLTQKPFCSALNVGSDCPRGAASNHLDMH